MTASVHKTVFNPNPVQKNFIESPAKADLFSSRMGEGKSTALAWAALYHTRHNPGASWAIIRDTYENIIGTTQKTFFQWFPPGVYGEYHATKKVFTWASGIAQGDVTFMGMDDQQDASKLMSREFAGFGIDEPAPAVGSAGVDEMIFDIALSRLRQGGMKWYCAKLAENNPDEAHWTFRRFVQPGDPEFKIWQPATPENMLHLPSHYYADLRKTWAHRPDLVRRFVDGEFGFQSLGKSVTPQWNDKIHLALGLAPMPRKDLYIFWDFGLNPTAILAQVTPMGQLQCLDCMVGDGIGVEELVQDWLRPLLTERYKPLNVTYKHIGDNQGTQREQSSSMRTAVRFIKRDLGGTWRSGPIKWESRIEPLRAALTKNIGGKGKILVDRERAPQVWHALRGGWHHHISRQGIVSGVPVKNIHSHPGDALSYGVSVLFPLGKLQSPRIGVAERGPAGYFGDRGPRGPAEALASIGKPVPAGTSMPKHGDKLG